MFGAGLRVGNAKMASLDKLDLVLGEDQFAIRTLSDKLRVRHRDRALNEPDHECMGHLFKTLDGHLIRGQKVFANTDRVNLDIKRIADGSLSLRISTNPNKWHHPWATSTDPGEYREFRSGLETEIDDLGISCDLSSARLARLDLARQKQLSHPLHSYHAVLHSLKARRQHKTAHQDSYRVGNRQRQISIYDKHTEANLDDSLRHLTRVEIRFLKSETTSKFTGLRLLSDLDHDITGAGFEHLQSVYSGYLESEVFSSPTGEEKVATILGYRHIASQIAQESPNGILGRFLGEIGIFEATRKAGGSDELADIITSTRDFKSDESRRRYHRRMRAQIESLFAGAISRQTIENQSFVSLYHELASFAHDEPTPISKTA